MAFQKYADISKKDAKVVPHNDPQVKRIKEEMANLKSKRAKSKNHIKVVQD